MAEHRGGRGGGPGRPGRGRPAAPTAHDAGAALAELIDWRELSTLGHAAWEKLPEARQVETILAARHTMAGLGITPGPVAARALAAGLILGRSAPDGLLDAVTFALMAVAETWDTEL